MQYIDPLVDYIDMTQARINRVMAGRHEEIENEIKSLERSGYGTLPAWYKKGKFPRCMNAMRMIDELDCDFVPTYMIETFMLSVSNDIQRIDEFKKLNTAIIGRIGEILHRLADEL